MLPNFFVVGAQKCATTSLHHFLAAHPEIYLPFEKETKFFVDNKRYTQGIEHYESEYFSKWKGERAVGEVDPDYIYFQHAIERVARDLNIHSVKFIVILRNPIERAFSHYLMSFRRGIETLAFEEALRIERQRIARDYLSKMHFSYQTRGYYFKQIQHLLQNIDGANLLITFTEDLVKSPEAFLKQIYRFLGVETEYCPENLSSVFHKGRIPRSVRLLRRMQQNSIEKSIMRILIPFDRLRSKLYHMIFSLNQRERHDLAMSNKARRILADAYARDMKNLGELCERDLSHWI